MVRIQEDTMKECMRDLMEDKIYPALGNAKDKISFDNSSAWWKDNPTTGKLYLTDFPQVKEAWVLVKFLENKTFNYGKQNVRQQHKTLRSVEDFEGFFGVKPTQNFADDMIIVCSWGKQLQQNKNTRDRYQAGNGYNFYMYVTHTQCGFPEMINRLLRIDKACHAKGITSSDDLYQIPYSLTGLK